MEQAVPEPPALYCGTETVEPIPDPADTPKLRFGKNRSLFRFPLQGDEGYGSEIQFYAHPGLETADDRITTQ